MIFQACIEILEDIENKESFRFCGMTRMNVYTTTFRHSWVFPNTTSNRNMIEARQMILIDMLI